MYPHRASVSLPLSSLTLVVRVCSCCPHLSHPLFKLYIMADVEPPLSYLSLYLCAHFCTPSTLRLRTSLMRLTLSLSVFLSCVWQIGKTALAWASNDEVRRLLA